LCSGRSLLDPEAVVTTYLPELKDSGFADATVRQVMDMTTAVKFSDDYGDPLADTWNYSVAMGLLAKPVGYTGPESIYDFLATKKRDGRHGVRFAYVTPNTDVLGWLIKRVLDKPLSDILHERIWSKLGAERDAVWLVDPTTAETAGSQDMLELLRNVRVSHRIMKIPILITHNGSLLPVKYGPLARLAGVPPGRRPAERYRR
jgi:CubicO group peptidase (beta-lactamase class C family)